MKLTNYYSFFKKHIVLLQLTVILIISVIATSAILVIDCMSSRHISDALGDAIISGLLTGFFFGWPFIIGILNLYYLFRRRPLEPQELSNERKCSLATIIVGGIYAILAINLTLNIIWVPWNVQLYNQQVHSPVDPSAGPTIIALMMLWVIGYFGLRIVNVKKIPPLIPVILIAMIYIGIAASFVWIIQTAMAILNRMSDIYVILLIDYYLVNLWLVSATLIRNKVSDYGEFVKANGIANPKVKGLGKLLSNHTNWPIIAIIAMLPVLAVCLCILLLFGQRPDAIIKAWTETSDWTLSLKQAPPNLVKDEHYLCTASATGHKALVKPIRMGQRHDHRVVVNRQLCIANAFEQLIEQQTPRFHYHIRKFYDTYGFPIAKLITTPLRADVVYILMKPLEYLFLGVLYMFTSNPEERIATQYIPENDAEEIIKAIKMAKIM